MKILKLINFRLCSLLILLCLFGCTLRVSEERPTSTPTVAFFLAQDMQKSKAIHVTSQTNQAINSTQTPILTVTSTVEVTSPLLAPTEISVMPSPKPIAQPLTPLQEARFRERIGDWENAFRLYKSLRDDPKDAHAALFYLGNLYLQEDQVVEAMDMWQEAIAIKPDGEFAQPSRYRLAIQLWEIAEYERANTLFEQFDESNDQADSFMAEKLAELYLFLGEEEKAVAQWMRLYDNPTTLRVTQALTAKKIGDWQAENEQWHSALRWYEQTLELSQIESFRAELLARIAEFALELDDQTLALQQWRLLVNLYPDQPEAITAAAALAERGEKLTAFKMGKLYLANGDWQAAVNAFYDSLDEEQDLAETHDLAARAYDGAGNYLAAQLEWQTILDDHQGATAWQDNALLEIGRMQAKQGQIEAALKSWAQVIELYPESEAAPLAQWERTESLYELYGDSDVSAAAFIQFAKSYPDNENAAYAFWKAGLYWYRQGKGQQAQAAFTQMAEVDKERPTKALFWAGKAAALAGDNQAAKRYWQEAISLKQADYYALRAADWLNGQAWLPRVHSSEDISHSSTDALNWLREAANLPQDADLYTLPNEPLLTQGYMLLLMEERDAAFTSILEAIRAHRDEPQALWAMAIDLKANHVNKYSLLAAERLMELLGYSPFTAPKMLAELAYPLPFEEQLRQSAKEWNYDPLFFAAMILQESRWEPRARSHAAARGLTQIIPDTATLIATGLKDDTFRYQDLDRPLISLHYGSYFLDYLLKTFDNNPFHTLAGYNGGPANAKRWMSSDDDLFVENITLPETRNYVEWVYEYWHAYQYIYRGQ